MAAELRAAKKERDFYLQQVGQAKALDAIQQRNQVRVTCNDACAPCAGTRLCWHWHPYDAFRRQRKRAGSQWKSLWRSSGGMGSGRSRLTQLHQGHQCWMMACCRL